MARFFLMVLVLATPGFFAGLLSQDDCASGVDLAWQDRPSEGPTFQTPELYAHQVDAIMAQAPSGAAGEATFYVSIVSQLPGVGGVQGWAIYFRNEGDLTIRSITTSGTAAAADTAVPPGVRDSEGSFNKTMINPHPPPFGGQSSLALTTQGKPSAMLNPVGTATVLGVTVAAPGPFTASSPREHSSTLEFVDNVLGYPYPGENIAVVNGAGVDFCSRRSVKVTIVPVTFRRGDANSDGSVNISDAIRIFMFLFSSGRDPECLDTADANDDGFVNIGDGISILLDFFREDTGIPQPGPFSCGQDPTEDGLPCASYVPCL